MVDISDQPSSLDTDYNHRGRIPFEFLPRRGLNEPHLIPGLVSREPPFQADTQAVLSPQEESPAVVDGSGLGLGSVSDVAVSDQVEPHPVGVHQPCPPELPSSSIERPQIGDVSMEQEDPVRLLLA